MRVGYRTGVTSGRPSRGETSRGGPPAKASREAPPRMARRSAPVTASAFQIEARCRDADDDAHRATAKT